MVNSLKCDRGWLGQLDCKYQAIVEELDHYLLMRDSCRRSNSFEPITFTGRPESWYSFALTLTFGHFCLSATFCTPFDEVHSYVLSTFSAVPLLIMKQADS